MPEKDLLHTALSAKTPKHLWNPPYCGEIDIRIARDGTWFHEGSPIGRTRLVKLFASILRYEAGRFYLVTPVEKVGITVEDSPFIAKDFTCVQGDHGQEVTFHTTLGERALASAAHPLRIEIAADQSPCPYVMIRDGLEARIDRKSFYRLVPLCEITDHAGEEWLGLRSAGAFFPFIRAAQL